LCSSIVHFFLTDFFFKVKRKLKKELGIMTTGTCKKKKITYYILTWGSGIITMQILPTTSGQSGNNNNNYYRSSIHQHGTLNDGIVVVVGDPATQLFDCLLASFACAF
jgi:hypothetical protein